MQSLGQRIKFYREAAGLSQQELADSLKVTQSSVQQWESGNSNVQSKRIPLIAKTLGITEKDLASDMPPATVPYRKPSPNEMALHIFDSMGFTGKQKDVFRLLLKNEFSQEQLGAIENYVSGLLSAVTPTPNNQRESS